MKLTGSNSEANMKSKYSGEIVDVRLMGKDKYAVAQTMETLIICMSIIFSTDPYNGLGILFCIFVGR